MLLSSCLTLAIGKLKQAGIETPEIDARLLACHALGCDRAALLSHSSRVLKDDEVAAIDALIERRKAREPVSRIVGKREFWGLSFGLNEATLDPRPDSETLIEAVLATVSSPLRGGLGRGECSENNLKTASPRILDLGTGTGCLLLALLHEIPKATGIGIDIDPRAVEQTTENAKTLGLDDRAAFYTGDWLSSPPPRRDGSEGGREAETALGTFDIIVSNPPYIPEDVIPTLMPEVRDYAPAQALNGGSDGLDPYRLLIPQLHNFLNPGGLVAFEVGIGQADAVAALFQENGFTNIAKHKDLGGIDRCVTAHIS